MLKTSSFEDIRSNHQIALILGRILQRTGFSLLSVLLVNAVFGLAVANAASALSSNLRYEAYDLSGAAVNTTYMLEHYGFDVSLLGVPGNRQLSKSPSEDALEHIRIHAGGGIIQSQFVGNPRSCAPEETLPWVNDNGIGPDGNPGDCFIDVLGDGVGHASVMVEASPTAKDSADNVLVFDHWETELTGDICVNDPGLAQGRRYTAYFRFDGGSEYRVSPRADARDFPACMPQVVYKAIYAPAATANDADSDLIADADDNCPAIENTDQDDLDADGLGDACDDFIDNDKDGLANENDNCLNMPNSSQENLDGDHLGDICDADDDGDGIYDYGYIRGEYDHGGGSGVTFHEGIDNCPVIANPNQEDFDEDLVGDVCDDDDDNDNVLDVDDNCHFFANPGQEDADQDGTGDVCDGDPDGDGLFTNAGDSDQQDCNDNCPNVFNPDQINTDLVSHYWCGTSREAGDLLGDACDLDDDDDGIPDVEDNCQLVKNPEQENIDNDEFGDACDQTATIKDINGNPLLITLDNGVFTKVEPVIAPVGAPTDLDYANGFFKIEIAVATAGDSVTVTVAGLATRPEKIIKCLGVTCDEYPSVIDAESFSIVLTDGGAGDEDGVANGIILDPVASANTPTATTDGGASGSGGTSDSGGAKSKWYKKGCVMGAPEGAVDPTLLLLIALSLLVMWRRRAI